LYAPVAATACAIAVPALIGVVYAVLLLVATAALPALADVPAVRAKPTP
jgi:hypothetical protein